MNGESYNEKRSAIIGGGLTGLAAAYYLQRKLKQEDFPYEVLLIATAGPCLGGKVHVFLAGSSYDGFSLPDCIDQSVVDK
ncbi:NAD(P)-binding protein [Peribacillus sp. NPDC096540]|uniref:NAD(P)-binding protein n=1 Tax=Peribacillus sp. NPDC096540 TaxID=3390612 RepID=UPI003D03BF4A